MLMLLLALLAPTWSLALAVGEAEDAPAPTFRLDQVREAALAALRLARWPQFRTDRQGRLFVWGTNVAERWHDPQLRRALLDLLDDAHPSVVAAAAETLAAYPDAEVQRRLRTLLGDRRALRGWGVAGTVGERVAKALARPPTQATPFRPTAELLQIDEDGVVVFHRSDTADMTIPLAARLLNSDELSVRLRAFLWLAEYGIILDARPLAQAWPRLDAGRREALLLELVAAEIHVGAAELRRVLERLIEDQQHCDSSNEWAALLCVATQAGSARAWRAALELIDEHLAGGARAAQTQPAAYLCDPNTLEFAFLAVSRRAGQVPVDRAVAWVRSDNPTVHYGGLCVLAGMDDWQAAYIVLGYLATMAPEHGYLDPVGTLEERDWNDAEIKWHYLRGIGRILMQELRRYPDEEMVQIAFPRERPPADLIELLEAISQTTQGPSGTRFPIMELYNAHEAKQTARKWQAWIDANGN